MRLFVALPVALLCLLVFSSCTPAVIRHNDELADEFLRAHPETSLSFISNSVRLHYVGYGVKTLPKIIFIHGSPGSWRSFAAFLEEPALATRAFLLMPDRPGYGGSNDGQPMRSLAEQARVLSGLLDLGDSKQSAILIGHSYGGAVVARMAMQNDARIKAIVIAAGSVDPDLEHKKWFQYPADWFFVRWILPSALDSCNQEIEALKEELVSMLPQWTRISCKVDVVQGLSDELVPPENADFIERHLKETRASVTRIAKQGHFLPWQQHDLLRARVKDALDSLLAQAKAPSL